MADTLKTAAQLLKLADQNLAPGFASDLLIDAPLIAMMAATAANASQGMQHKYLKHVSAPTVGFRPVNTGVDITASDQSLVTVDLKTLSANVRMDQQIAQAHPAGVEVCMDIEGMLALQNAFSAGEKQLIYGSSADSNGFTGIAQAATIDGLTDGMVTNATGTSALTSVYLMRFGEADCELILGRDGNIQQGATFEQMVADSSGKLFPAFVRIQEALMSIKVGGIYSLGRICNIGTATGKTLTDALLYQAISTFPSNRGPSVIVMNRRSIYQLRASRTATNPTGTAAPLPTEIEGIPIVVTDSVNNSETAVA
jgi:hypothetical protein